MLRLNDCSRTFAEVPNSLLSYCFVKDNIFNLPPLQELLKKRVVITTCRDAAMLVQARLTNRDIADLYTNVAKALYPLNSPSTDQRCHWLSLIIDEAAQATEPETAIPMTVVDPPLGIERVDYPQFIMAGDEHQLNARIYGPSSALKISLFERLAKRSPYTSHPLARKNMNRRNTDSSIKRAPFVNLVRNYRSHEAILALPSALFYHNTLIPEATETTSLLHWHGWKGLQWPILLACNGGIDESESLRDFGIGWYNDWEISKALQYAKSLINSTPSLAPSEICIMSPFPSQVRRLRQQARNEMMHSLNIGPMEAFQGLESRLVIICTTRTRARFLKDDEKKGIGIIGNEKKFNVAITRAKEGLIVIGNPWTMSTNEYWRRFLKFCYRNGLVEGEAYHDPRMRDIQEGNPNGWWTTSLAKKDKYDDWNNLTGLERAIILKERDQSHQVNETRRRLGGQTLEDAFWQLGMDAQESLEPEIENQDAQPFYN